MRKLPLLGAVLLALVAFVALPAEASTLDWSYTDGGTNTGSGTISLFGLGGNAYLVQSITGTANGQTVTGLTNYAGQDQIVFFPAVNLVDSFGLAFTVTGNLAYNLYFWTTAGAGVDGYDCGVTGYCLLGPGTPGTDGLGIPPDVAQDPTVPVQFSLIDPTAAVPLPNAIFMLVTGLATLGLLAAWRKPKNAV